MIGRSVRELYEAAREIGRLQGTKKTGLVAPRGQR